MFSSLDEYGGYNIENPMVRDSSRSYEDAEYDDLLEENGDLLNVFIGIDTSRLTEDEEGELFENLGNIEYQTNYPDWELGDFDMGNLETELIGMPEFENDELKYGYIEVRGYARESVYEKILDLLDKYDVSYNEK